MKFLIIALLIFPVSALAQTYEGQLTKNPFNSKSIDNPSSSFYDPFLKQQVNAPKLFNNKNEYRGELSNDPFALDSISNRYGKYGSEYSLESINNPYGAGSQYKLDSPNNPYGSGWSVYSSDTFDTTLKPLTPLTPLTSFDNW